MKTLFHGVGYIFDGAGCLAGAVEYIAHTVNDMLLRVEHSFIAYLKILLFKCLLLERKCKLCLEFFLFR